MKPLHIVLLFIISTPALALTISSSPDVNIQQLVDKENNTILFTTLDSNANINTATINSALGKANVIIRDDKHLDISIVDNSNISWSSPYNLIINASHNIIIGNLSQLTSYGYGNVVLRADSSGDNDGTVIMPVNTQTVINMVNGGSIKIFYHPLDYKLPTNFSPYIKVSSPGISLAYMAINDLLDMQKMNQNLQGNYALAKNIDATGFHYSPIGNYNQPFTGRFDGQGYYIKNLTIGLPNIDYAGLFGGANRATIENVIIDTANITGRDYVGGLSGYGYGVTVNNCSVKGNIWGRQSVGGLIGYASYSAVITRAFTEGSVNLTGNYGGGLIGYALNNVVTINDSYSSSQINNIGGTALYLGGLYGYNLSVFTKNAYAVGNVSQANNTSGGLLGYASSQYNYQSTFWDTNKTNQSKAAGNYQTITGTKGLTTDEMQLKNTYVDAGWDFNYTWEIEEGKNYPTLMWIRKAAPYTLMPTGQARFKIL